MAVRARVAHHVPGRMRIEIREARRNHHLAGRLKESLSSIEGVKHVEVRPATGSVVVHYRGVHPKDLREAVFDQGQSSGLYSLAPPEIGEGGEIMGGIQREAEFLAAHSTLAREVVEDARKLDTAVKRATNNNLDLKVLFPLLLAAGSVSFFGTEMSTPLWVSLGLYSFNSFVALHRSLVNGASESQERPPQP